MRVETSDNRHYLIVDDLAYRLDHPANGEVLDGRQVGFCLRGDYGSLAQEIAQAQEEIGVPVRMAWRGVMNGMGDLDEVFPPTKPRDAAEILNF